VLCFIKIENDKSKLDFNLGLSLNALGLARRLAKTGKNISTLTHLRCTSFMKLGEKQNEFF